MTVYWQIGQLVQRKTVIEENWKEIDPVLDGEYFDVEIFTLQKNKMTDMHTAALMADHFDKIQKLPNPLEGVPNWRCVPGYQVSGKVFTKIYFILNLFLILGLLLWPANKAGF